MTARKSRSQNAASRASQPGPSQRRGTSQNQPVWSDEEQEHQTQNGFGEDQELDDEDGDAPGSSFADELDRKANDLVRLALFTEQRRMPLKRDDITKKGAYFFSSSFIVPIYLLWVCCSPWSEWRTRVQGCVPEGPTHSTQDLRDGTR